MAFLLEKIQQNDLTAFVTKENVAKVAATALCGITVAYLGKIWFSYDYFKKKGIKTPNYKFFFGNFLELKKNRNYSEVIAEWTKTYGKTYGYYEGHLPILVTSDLDLIEEIFIKQFVNFAARKKSAIEVPEHANGRSLFIATDVSWKRMRNIMNPTFSSSKMRELNPLILICVDRLIEKLQQTEGSELNVTETLKRFTMDTIWQCAFGVDADSQNQIDDPYYKKCEKVFTDIADFNLLMYLGIYFHEFQDYLFYVLLGFSKIFGLISKNLMNPFVWLLTEIRTIYNLRRNNPQVKKRDYIQILLETQTDQKISVSPQSVNTSQSHDFSKIHFERKMTPEEVNINLVLFLLAGYETSSTALSYISFVLATHPVEQSKLISEIDEHFKEVEPNTDNVQKLHYLDIFVKETLRMYPIANAAITRRCIHPTTIKGIEFTKNLPVAIDVLSIHNDPDIWGPVDPFKFYPQRFDPENKRQNLAYMPFGLGPKNCIGMKFALIEIKIALVKILRQFQVIPSANTPEKLEFIEGIVRSPKHGIKVQFKKRASE